SSGCHCFCRNVVAWWWLGGGSPDLVLTVASVMVVVR
ncbi:hypothetical protein A2U01_0094192, partial [Trifolium medium]|nr:hypothetical protein [Trifolium medium]